MRVLVVNCGSSTLKFQLIDTAKEDAAPAAERYLARGVIERIGSQAALDFQAGSNVYQDTAAITDHEEASRRVLAWLDTAGFLALWNASDEHHGRRPTSIPIIAQEAPISHDRLYR